ncbi:Transcriptional activator protein Anr [Burkholderiales bacterium 8X]|nr:Transcriptional activator protein Anr [Burkholderiales bacterium 8X]
MITSPTSTTSRLDQGMAGRIGDTLRLVAEALPVQRRVLHAGDSVYQAGQPFKSLYIVNSGFFKMVNSSAEGREQLVGLHFRGDWLGLDGIADGRYACDAVAMDTGEIWSIRYDALLQAASQTPALLSMLHCAMSREIAREQQSVLSLCSLPAEARVAGFLRYWAETLADRGLRTDQITLRMTRAEIGNYLGMTLETVSRALSRLARGDVIRFAEKSRRDICIPQVEALTRFMQGDLGTPATPLH